MQAFAENDFYVHLTSDGIKKEGPSAGCAVTSSILSLLLNQKILNNISLSGEMTLSGKLLKVGGLKEKIILAMKVGIDTVYLPKDNENDLKEIEDIYQDKIKVILVDNYVEIYNNLFKK